MDQLNNTSMKKTLPHFKPVPLSGHTENAVPYSVEYVSLRKRILQKSRKLNWASIIYSIVLLGCICLMAACRASDCACPK